MKKNFKSQTSKAFLDDWGISHSMNSLRRGSNHPCEKVGDGFGRMIKKTRYPKDTLDIHCLGNWAWQIEIKGFNPITTGPYHTIRLPVLESDGFAPKEGKIQTNRYSWSLDGKNLLWPSKSDIKYYKNAFEVIVRIGRNAQSLLRNCRKLKIQVPHLWLASGSLFEEFVKEFTKSITVMLITQLEGD